MCREPSLVSVEHQHWRSLRHPSVVCVELLQPRHALDKHDGAPKEEHHHANKGHNAAKEGNNGEDDGAQSGGSN